VISELTFDTAPRFGSGSGSAHHLYPQTQPPPTVYGSHRPLSGGTTTMSSSGQASPGTNSQRTSGQHDAIAGGSGSGSGAVVAAGGGPTATTTLSGGVGVGGGVDSSGVLSDGEEYGILDDDEGHDSTNSATYGGSGKPHGIGMGAANGDGPATAATNSNNKKKSLLKRIGKKLRPFKMPHLSSSAAAAAAAGGGGGASGPDTPLPASATSSSHPPQSSLSSSFDALKSPFRSSHAHHAAGDDTASAPISRSRSQSDAAAPTAAFLSTSKDHFQQFLQHLTPRHHNSHHHSNGHHHNDSDRETATHNLNLSTSSRSAQGGGGGGGGSHHKSHRHHHHHHQQQQQHHANGSSHSHLPPPPPPSYGAGSGSFLGTTGDGPVDVCAPLPVRYGLRIQVRAVCRYRVCAANPTGFVDEDSWATLTGTFHQSFLLVGDGRSQLGITDRLVTIEVDGCTAPLTTGGGGGSSGGGGGGGSTATFESDMLSSPVAHRMAAPFSSGGGEGQGGYATPK
jgi:hypothetical protein